jgi:hypothetical protein
MITNWDAVPNLSLRVACWLLLLTLFCHELMTARTREDEGMNGGQSPV